MGEVFAGRYELVDPIGRGGVGAVWRAWDHRRRRYVAAKVLQQRDAHALLRFVREQALRIDHPHVLAPASWAADDDQVLFTMDLVAGGSLAHLVGDYGPLPPAFVCTLLDQLLAGLAAVHAEGVVHRDIKPANILLEATGTARPRLRLSDFGIAMRLGEPRLTETNLVVGTPGYLAPEQMLGAEPDFPADLFGVGLVALYLLEGAKPDAKALVQYFAAHGTPSAPQGIPEPLWQVVASMLQPDPQARFRTATGARKALASAVELLPEPGPDDELIEIFDQLGPLPPGFAPEGPLKKAQGVEQGPGSGSGASRTGGSRVTAGHGTNSVSAQPGTDAPNGYPGTGFPAADPGTGIPAAVPGTGFPAAVPGTGFPAGVPGTGPATGHPGVGPAAAQADAGPGAAVPGTDSSTARPAMGSAAAQAGTRPVTAHPPGAGPAPARPDTGPGAAAEGPGTGSVPAWPGWDGSGTPGRDGTDGTGPSRADGFGSSGVGGTGPSTADGFRSPGLGGTGSSGADGSGSSGAGGSGSSAASGTGPSRSGAGFVPAPADPRHRTGSLPESNSAAASRSADVPARPAVHSESSAPAQPIAMSDTGSFHLPPPQATASSPQTPAPQPQHQHPQPTAQPYQGPPHQPPHVSPHDPTHVLSSPRPTAPRYPTHTPPTAPHQHRETSTASYTAQVPQLPQVPQVPQTAQAISQPRHRADRRARRRSGPPAKAAIPILLLALACYAVGFWALTRI